MVQYVPVKLESGERVTTKKIIRDECRSQASDIADRISQNHFQNMIGYDRKDRRFRRVANMADASFNHESWIFVTIATNKLKELTRRKHQMCV